MVRKFRLITYYTISNGSILVHEKGTSWTKIEQPMITGGYSDLA